MFNDEYVMGQNILWQRQMSNVFNYNFQVSLGRNDMTYEKISYYKYTLDKFSISSMSEIIYQSADQGCVE